MNLIVFMWLLFFIGEPCSVKLVSLSKSDNTKNCSLWNLYGLTETTVASTFHRVDVAVNTKIIPIGQPFPNYQHIILDVFWQPVIIDQEGELFIGGVGIFTGYLGRDDLTA